MRGRVGEICDEVLLAADAASKATSLLIVRTRGVPTDAAEMVYHAAVGFGSPARSIAAGAGEFRTMALSGKKLSLCSGEKHRHQQVG